MGRRDCGRFGVGAQAVQKSDGCGHVRWMVFLAAQTKQIEYVSSFTGTKESSAVRTPEKSAFGATS